MLVEHDTFPSFRERAEALIERQMILLEVMNAHAAFRQDTGREPTHVIMSYDIYREVSDELTRLSQVVLTTDDETSRICGCAVAILKSNRTKYVRFACIEDPR